MQSGQEPDGRANHNDFGGSVTDLASRKGPLPSQTRGRQSKSGRGMEVMRALANDGMTMRWYDDDRADMMCPKWYSTLRTLPD
jgi:hypothetical protein